MHEASSWLDSTVDVRRLLEFGIPLDIAAISSYLDDMDLVILDSAHKHGIEDEDVLHAYRNPIRVFDLGDIVMLVGADQNGRPREIGGAEGEEVVFVVHAMPARSKFLR